MKTIEIKGSRDLFTLDMIKYIVKQAKVKSETVKVYVSSNNIKTLAVSLINGKVNFYNAIYYNGVYDLISNITPEQANSVSAGIITDRPYEFYY